MADAPKMTWTGESGRQYEYWVYEATASWNPGQPGNYIFTRREPNATSGAWDHYPLYIGETDVGLQERIASHEKWPCVNGRGVTHICVHTNTKKEAREAEETDLRHKFAPPCNKE